MPGLVENSIGMVNPLQGFVQVEGFPQKQSSKRCRNQHGDHNHPAKQRFEIRIFHRNKSLSSHSLLENQPNYPYRSSSEQFPITVLWDEQIATICESLAIIS
jgi:hypothetical protein